jgi:ATP synthase protein I
MPVTSLCRLPTAAPLAGGRPSSSCLRPRHRATRAAADNADAPAAKPPPTPAAAPAPLDLPTRGLFALADPTAEVYGKAGAEPFDPAKKPKGRYAKEFLWQTDWRGTLKRQEDLERQMREYEQATKGGLDGGASGGGGGAASVAPAPMISGGSGPSVALPGEAAVASPGVAAALAERRAAQRGAGRVALSRLSVLDDASADLSAELAVAAARRKAEDERKRTKQAAAQATAEASGGNAANANNPASSAPIRRRAATAASSSGPGAVSPSYRLKDLPSRGELRRFARATRGANAAASAVAASANAQLSLSPEERAARDAAAAEATARYEKLKIEFQAWTLGMGLLGSVAAYFSYGPQTAASYAIGASSGLTYLRLLSRSVDSVGGGGGAAGAALGQPRLLVPVVMALSYNRWNTLYADEYGLALELLPMLAGFFTYKMAVIFRQGKELLAEIGAGGSEERPQEGGGGSPAAELTLRSDPLGEGYVSESMTLDRIFVKRVIKEM